MKSTYPRISAEKLIEAIQLHNGNLAAVARTLKASRSGIYKRLKQLPSAQEALKDARETMLDEAEATLYQDALTGNTTALIFFLKTQGKSRGYTEKVEHVGNQAEPVVIAVVQKDDYDAI